MRGYLIRRLLYALPTLFAVASLTFLLTRLAPGDPFRLVAFGAQLDATDLDALNRHYGFDRPLYEQYALYLGQLVRLDFGSSLQYHQPALGLVLQRLPNTLTLAFAALALQLLVGITLGLVAAARRGGRIDGAVRVLAVVGNAVPQFWIGLLAILLFAVTMRVLPGGGVLTIGASQSDVIDRLRHLLLPAAVLALPGIATYSRFIRTEALEVLRQDYIRVARAKGLRARDVFAVHTLRNALLPVVTALGGALAYLVSSVLVIETVFSWPGLGKLVYDASLAKDYPIVTAGVLFVSALLVAGYFLRDLLYAAVDPRIATR